MSTPTLYRSGDATPSKRLPLHSHQQNGSKNLTRGFTNKNPLRLFRRSKQRTDSAASADMQGLNVLQWLQSFCPEDVLPKVLAFAGPQKTAALSKTNRHWHAVMQKEGTWRVLCEELYKVCVVSYAACSSAWSSLFEYVFTYHDAPFTF
jgi:hypothetical protein